MHNNPHGIACLTNSARPPKRIGDHKSAWRCCLDLQSSAFRIGCVACFETLCFIIAFITRLSTKNNTSGTICLLLTGFAIPSYELVDPYVQRLTSRALPTPQMAILAKRRCRNRDPAVPSSRRLSTSCRCLMGCLRAAFWLPGLLLGRSLKMLEAHPP